MKNSSYLARHCVILSLFRAPGVPPGFLSCGRSSFAGVVRPLFLLVPVKKNLTLSPAPICSRGFVDTFVRFLTDVPGLYTRGVLILRKFARAWLTVSRLLSCRDLNGPRPPIYLSPPLVMPLPLLPVFLKNPPGLEVVTPASRAGCSNMPCTRGVYLAPGSRS